MQLKRLTDTETVARRKLSITLVHFYTFYNVRHVDVQTPKEGHTAHGRHHHCYLQWNLSIKDTLNEGHLSNKDTVCSPNHIELCTNLPLN